MKFREESQTDILKVMNENTLPCTYKIDSVYDSSKAAPIDRNCGYMQDQVEVVKRVVDAVGGGR